MLENQNDTTRAPRATGEGHAVSPGTRVGTAHPDLDHGTYRCAIRQADMLIRRARDRARAQRTYTRTGRITKEGERIVARLDALAEEVWALAKNPPADRDAANALDLKIENEWWGGVEAADDENGV